MKLLHSAKLNITLIVLLIAALVAIGVLYPRATRPLVFDHDQALIERATRQAADLTKGNPDIVRTTFPIVMHLTDRSCVELRSTRSDGAGTYTVCFERQTGNFIEERLVGPSN
jgi:hypothetical protein